MQFTMRKTNLHSFTFTALKWPSGPNKERNLVLILNMESETF